MKLHRLVRVIRSSSSFFFQPRSRDFLTVPSDFRTFPSVFSVPTRPVFSIMTTTDIKPSLNSTDSSKADPKAKFREVFDDLLETVLSDANSDFDLPKDKIVYLRDMISYNVPHGKLNRGLTVFQCYKAFCSDSAVSNENEYFANVLGWCVEFLQAFFLVADDIMDDSLTRRGRPCYFRLPEIGLNAINDSIILQSMIYRILRIKFRGQTIYPELVSLFHDISYTTELGQLLDLTSHPPGVVDLDCFTEDVLARIYKYKTSHYTFYLPVALGMQLAGVTEKRCYDTAKDICLKIGHYFQAQDDFIDAFGDPKVTGKVGTDIEENTCTWLVVQALKMVNEEQRKVLDENYGRKDPICAQRVKDVYRELGLEDKFANFEKKSYEELCKEIAAVDHMPTGALEFLLSKIYKRNK